MEMRHCERCMEPLPPERLVYQNSRFCSEDCRWRGYHHRNRAVLREYNRRWNKDHPESAVATRLKTREKRISYLKEWKAKNPERVKELRRLSQKRCKESAVIRRNKWIKKYPDKMKESRRKWLVNNSEKRAANVRYRQLVKSRATPQWLTKDEKLQMVVYYAEAARLTKEKGVPHEVDHIVPIRGKYVCGLHVPWNLQVLTADENRRKSARC